MMKISVGLLITGLSLVVLSPATALASSVEDSVKPVVNQATIKQNIDKRFSKLKDTDEVLVVKDGYLFGQAEFGQVQNGIRTVKKVYDSQKDPAHITVKEAKERELAQTLDNLKTDKLSASTDTPLLRGANIPTDYYMLTMSDSAYVSNSFSGSGWRYAGFWFYHEHYLQGALSQGWVAYGDSGKVGDKGDINTHGGITLNPTGDYTKITPTTSVYLTFYTYSPAAGSGYMVAAW